MRKPRKDTDRGGNGSTLYYVLQRTGLSERRINGLVFGVGHKASFNKLKYRPELLSIREILIISGILQGRYSFTLLCSLAAGYKWGKAPKSWFDQELPPIPPELEELEQVVMSKKELKRLKEGNLGK